jgi:hypothetical protein
MVNKLFTRRPLAREAAAGVGSGRFYGGKLMRCVAIAALGALFCLSPAQADVLVNVSKSQQRAAVMIDGVEAYRWPVSTGVRGHDTPAGKFRPQRLERRWYSRQYDMTPMPWAVFFHRGYAVHGTMEAYNLGRAASHGCVRLRPDNAAILYSLVRRQGIANTRIVVMNGALPVPQPVPDAKPVDVADLPGAAPHHFASANGRAEFSAKTHTPAEMSEDADQANIQRAARFARTVSYRVSVSSDETQILRERDAWLRSLDRKYGITR